MTSTLVDIPTLDFAGSLAGFPEAHRFALVRLVPDNETLFRLTCLDVEDLEFVVAAPFRFFPHYVPEIDDATAARLELTDASDAMLLVLLTVGESVFDTTANLFAPLVVNIHTRQAGQAVLTGSSHSLREPLAQL